MRGVSHPSRESPPSTETQQTPCAPRTPSQADVTSSVTRAASGHSAKGVRWVSVSAGPAGPEITSRAQVLRALQPQGRACHHADTMASCGGATRTRRRSLLPCSFSVNLELSPKCALPGPWSSCSQQRWRRPSRPRTPAPGRLAVGSRAGESDSAPAGSAREEGRPTPLGRESRVHFGHMLSRGAAALTGAGNPCPTRRRC